MPPFSNKKKKEQLQKKRQLKRERADDPNSFYKSIMQKTHFRGKPIGQKQKTTGENAKANEARSMGGRERFADLQFFRDTDEEIRLRKEQAMLPIVPLEDIELEIDAQLPAAALDMPKRPPWNKMLTKEQLDKNERTYFKNFVDSLLERAALEDKKLSYFDLNIDTWRQLWRVLEMSEVITIIVDIRHPLFHFPPSLYNYIVNELKKYVIIVLNKIDLVPASLVLAWEHYLKSQYPEAHIIPFASYAGMKAKTNGKRVGKLHMAADGARRFMHEVEKVIGPGKVDFTSWREKIQQDSDEQAPLDDAESLGSSHHDEIEEEDDDEDEYGAAALKKAEQIKAKNDTDFYSAERYKDGILTIGCVGHPNVGKSSFMNALYGRKVVSVSRTPGHTKHFQTIFLTPNIRLCDCPGLVFPSFYPKQLQVLMGCYPISQLREPHSSIQYLAERVDLVQKLGLKPADEVRHQKPVVNNPDFVPSKVVQITDKIATEEHTNEKDANSDDSDDESAVNSDAETESVTQSECQDECKATNDAPKRHGKVVGVSNEWSAFTLCESYAMHRGFVTARSGRPDVYRAANHLLRMALDGRTLCMAFYPPNYLVERDSHWSSHERIKEIERVQGKHNIINDDW